MANPVAERAMETRTMVKPPKPIEGAASVNRLMSIGDETRLLRKRERPFHCLRNKVHNLSSSRHSWDREIRSSYRFFVPDS